MALSHSLQSIPACTAPTCRSSEGAPRGSGPETLFCRSSIAIHRHIYCIKGIISHCDRKTIEHHPRSTLRPTWRFRCHCLALISRGARTRSQRLTAHRPRAASASSTLPPSMCSWPPPSSAPRKPPNFLAAPKRAPTRRARTRAGRSAPPQGAAAADCWLPGDLRVGKLLGHTARLPRWGRARSARPLRSLTR